MKLRFARDWCGSRRPRCLRRRRRARRRRAGRNRIRRARSPSSNGSLKTEGYPEFPQIRRRVVQEDPSRRRHRLRGLPQRGLQDHHPGRAGRLRSAGRLLQLVRRGRRPPRPRRAGARHHRRSARRRAGSRPSSRRAGCRPSRSTADTTACRPTRCRKYFYYNKKFFADNGLQPPADFDELLGLCKKVREIDPEHGAAAARQFRALEAQPLHHHVQRAGARRRRHRGGLRAHQFRGQALHRSRLCRGLAKGRST